MSARRSEDSDDLHVPLFDLRRRLRQPRLVEIATKLEGLRVSDTEIDADETVALSVAVEAVTDGVTVTGEIRATWRGECHLCLHSVSGDLMAEITEMFAESPADEDIYRLHREHIDLRPMVTDALLLELPLLARCPNGGVGQCERAPIAEPDDDPADELPSEEPTLDPRWAALDSVEFDE